MKHRGLCACGGGGTETKHRIAPGWVVFALLMGCSWVWAETPPNATDRETTPTTRIGAADATPGMDTSLLESLSRMEDSEIPPLVVVATFDQFRSDYVTRFAYQFGPGGFQRVMRDGYWARDFQYEHAVTGSATGLSVLATLGYVQIEAVDPLRAALIGATPLLTGTLALTAIGTSVLALDRLGLLLASLRLQDLPSALYATPAVPWWGAWVYLAVVVSNTMLPSRSDRSAWGWVVACVGLLAVGILALGWGEEVARLAVAPLGALLAYLAGAFTLTAALDLLLGLPMWALEVVSRRRA